MTFDPEALAGRVITKYEASDRLRLHYRSLERLVRAGAFPKIKLGSFTVRFHLDDIRDYVLENKERSTEVAGGVVPHAELAAEIRAAVGLPFPEGEQLLTVKEAASWLGVSSVTVTAWVNQGWLSRVRLLPLRAVRYDAFDVVNFIEARRPIRRGVWREEPIYPKAVLYGERGHAGEARKAFREVSG